MPEATTVERKILLGQQPSGAPELFVFCPLYRTQVELDRCVACEFYRGLCQDGGCYLRCRYPDAVLATAAVAGGRS